MVRATIAFALPSRILTIAFASHRCLTIAVAVNGWTGMRIVSHTSDFGYSVVRVSYTSIPEMRQHA